MAVRLLPCSDTAKAVHQEYIPEYASALLGLQPVISSAEERHAPEQVLISTTQCLLLAVFYTELKLLYGSGQ